MFPTVKPREFRDGYRDGVLQITVTKPPPVKFQRLITPPQTFGSMPKQTFLASSFPERVDRSVCNVLKQPLNAQRLSLNFATQPISAQVRSTRYLEALPEQTSLACQVSQDLNDMDRQIDDLHLPEAEEELLPHLIKEVTIGKVAHQIGHISTKCLGVTAEACIQTLTVKTPHNSQNPIRDRVISGCAPVVISEGVACVVKRTPAYMAIAGAQIVGHIAKKGEEEIQKVLDFFTCLEKEKGRYIPLCVAGECPDPYHASVNLKLACQAAQIPAKILNWIHHFLEEMGKETLDAIELTEENLQKAARWMIDHPPPDPIIP